MFKLITDKNVQLQTQSTLEFECSNMLCDSKNIYLISSTQLTNLNVSCVDENFSLFTISNDDVLVHQNLNISEIELIEQNNLFIYKINLLFEPNDVKKYESKVLIETDFNDFELNLVGYVEEIDERLLVTLQNMKRFLTEDYVIAFRESVNNSTAIDTKLYNRKIREYILNIHNMVNMIGSYKNLYTVIKYFGYGELLSLKEYWTDGSSYKSTPISNEVVTFIDKSLSSFKKTNQMSLVYQINEQRGVDEDSLPIFINVLSDVDNILTKMRALERVLKNDFLDITTHIVDIIGEFQSVVGHELNMMLDNATITSVNLNGFLPFEIVTKDIEIINHQVIVKPWLFNKPNIDFIQTETSKFVDDIFLIERKVGRFDEFDFMTKYLSSDFGLVEIKFNNFDKTKYQLIKFTVFDSVDDVIIDSGFSAIDDLLEDDLVLLGIKNCGEYKISFSLIDYYGGHHFFGTNEIIKVSYKEMRVKLGVYGNEGQLSPMVAWSTYESTNGGHKVPSVVSDNFDVNTWDSETNNPNVTIARYYSNDYDMLSTYTTLNNLNGIELQQMKNIPLINWATNYLTIIVDVIRNDDSCGFGITTHKGENIKFYEIEHDGSETQKITKLIDLLNKSELSEKFTFDILFYCDNPDGGLVDARPMLRMISKEISYDKRLVSIYTMNEKYDDFENHYVKNNVPCFSNLDAKLEFVTFNDNVIDDLRIKIDGVETIINNVDGDIDSIFNVIHTLENIYTFIDNTNNVLVIYCDKDIEMEHQSFGLQTSIVRAKHLSRIYTIQSGSDVNIGQPVFACIDNVRKTEISDIEWELFNPLTNESITKQKALAFRYVFNRVGVYSLKCSFKHNNKEHTFNIDGFIIIKTT